MRIQRSPLLFGCALIAVNCTSDDTPVSPVKLDARSALSFSARLGPRVVNIRPPGVEDYYVTVRPEINHELVADSLANLVDGKLGYVYQNFHAFTIFSVSAEGLARLAKLPAVLSIQKSSIGELATSQALPANDELWHLDQIDQLGGPRNFTFNYFYPGSGVHIFFLDSGIDTSSGEFADRVGEGVTYTDTPGFLPYAPYSSHGTRTAALAAGTTYGVAKSAIVHAVRIVSTGPTFRDTDLSSGVDWILGMAPALRGAGVVVNASLTANSSLTKAAFQRIAAYREIPLVKAAGNHGSYACSDTSNIGVEDMIVVGAIDRTSARWAYSDYGYCVEVFAPGVDVKSMGLGGVPETGSGTSLAAPIVAGVVASFVQDKISHYGPGSLLAGMAYTVIRAGLRDSVIDPMGSPNQRVNSLHNYFWFNGTSGSIYSDPVETKYYTFSMKDPVGGDGGVWSDYVWEVSTSGAGGPYSVVSTAPTYTRAIPPMSSQSFNVRLTATSAGQRTTNNLLVQVFPPRNCPMVTCPQ